MSIIHELRISETVIDAWSDILTTMYDETQHVNNTVIFTSKCWEIIHKKAPAHILHSLIDDKLEVVGRHDILEFKGSTRKTGDHWTILIFDLGRCQWCFYNSMRPRRGDSDQHLIGSFVVVKYIETKLRKLFKNKYCDHQLLKGETKKPESEACLQQNPDSLDCGVVVCHHIENVILRQAKKTGTFSKKAAGDYRAKMVTWFVDPAHVIVKPKLIV
ncbi:hypothetical protein ACS0TY_004738 [Phlomoides rotata]